MTVAEARCSTLDERPTPEAMREVFSLVPSSVAVVAGRPSAEQDAVGMVVGSLQSVSLEPALVSFTVGRSSTTWPKLSRCARLGISALGGGQADVCTQFSTRSPDRFSARLWQDGPGGSPILRNCLAWLECDIEEVIGVGDHSLVLASVTAMEGGGLESALIFRRRSFLEAR